MPHCDCSSIVIVSLQMIRNGVLDVIDVCILWCIVCIVNVSVNLLFIFVFVFDFSVY